jgi:hypothetical protein
VAQHDFNIANQGFPATRSDINNALVALASTSSGTSEPSTTYANQFWYDTTNNLLKFRNEADSAWITFAYLDQATNEWEIRSAVVQAVDSAGVVIKTDDGTAAISVNDDGSIDINHSGTTVVQTTADGIDIVSTGSIKIPVGTTAQRPSSPVTGDLRWNSTEGEAEIYDGTAFTAVGAGGGLFKGENGIVGSSAGDIFRINEQTLNTNVTIDADENASATGPLTVASGVTLTVTTGGNLSIV